MKAITLRNLPPEIERSIERRAAQEGISLNKAVIRMLLEGRAEKGRTARRDLSFLAGKWTKQDADAFDQALKEQRQIDWEMWK